MAIKGIVQRPCPIGKCTAYVIEVLDDKELWAITCIKCGTTYQLEHKDDNDDPNDEDSYDEG